MLTAIDSTTKDCNNWQKTTTGCKRGGNGVSGVASASILRQQNFSQKFTAC